MTELNKFSNETDYKADEKFNRLFLLFHTGTEVKRELLDWHLSEKELDLLEWLTSLSKQFLQFVDVKRALRKSETIQSTDLVLNTIDIVLENNCFDMFWDCCLLNTSFENVISSHKELLYSRYENLDKQHENRILTKDQLDTLFKCVENSVTDEVGNEQCTYPSKRIIASLDSELNVFILSVICPLFISVNAVSECQSQITKIAVLKNEVDDDKFTALWNKMEKNINYISSYCKDSEYFKRQFTKIKKTKCNRTLAQQNRKDILEEAFNNPDFVSDKVFCNRVRKELDLMTNEENLNLAKILSGGNIHVQLTDGKCRKGAYSLSVIDNAEKNLECLHSLSSSLDTEEHQEVVVEKAEIDDNQIKLLRSNHLKLVQLITEIARDVLSDVLKERIPSGSFGVTFNGMKTKILPLLDNHGCQLLYPDYSYYKGDLSDMDITLLYIILRNLSTIGPHTNEWGNRPNDDDRSLSANIDRIRRAKNMFVSHRSKHLLNTEDFWKVWKDIRQCIIEIATPLTSCTDYSDRMDYLLASGIDPTAEIQLCNAYKRDTKGQIRLERKIMCVQENDDVLIQFDGYDVQCLLDRRLSTTFYQTEGLGNNDVLVQCDGYNVHCLLDRRLSTPFYQTEKLGDKVDCKIVKEREELAGAIKMMKNGTLSENSVKIFNRCVRNGYSLCCRFLLKCHQSLYLKLCLMEAVKTSIHLSINASNSPEKAKHADTTKAIARQITRMFYNNQNEKQLFRNVYPAFKCVCENKNCTDFFCSNDLYIVVEVGNYISTLPINYEAFKIYQQYARDFPTEGMLISQEQKKSLLYRSCSVSLSHGVPLAFANQCFINYSNIVSIVPSFLRSKHFNSTRHKFTVEKCATITCSAKGFIPIGERHFPDSVKAADGTIVSTDVIVGNVTLANLMVGDHIESTVMSGTLGGVLLYYNRNCFITCAHVMLDEQSMISRKANQIHKKDLRVFVRDGNGKRIECGNTLRCDFETGSDTKPGIDVAIIEINSQFKVDPNAMVKDQAKNLHSHLYLGMSNEYLNDNCIDYELLTLTNSHVEVMAFGQQTTIEKCKTVFEPEQVIEVELKSMGQAAAVANGNTTFPVMIAQPAHFQIFQGQFPGTRTFRMYNQLCLNVPLVSGDSGTCIYLRNCPYASANVKCNLSDTNGKCPHSGCLGMAIAFSNGMSIVTPLKKIFEYIL